VRCRPLYYGLMRQPVHSGRYFGGRTTEEWAMTHLDELNAVLSAITMDVEYAIGQLRQHRNWTVQWMP
jgi:hypothetical protein